MSLILVIILFSLLIFVHELGHFIVSKLCGVKVEQFTIGFGPAIFKKQIGDTLYAIRLLPLGGAVMMKGESGEEQLLVGDNISDVIDAEPQDDSDSFINAGKLSRFLICVAGSFMNLLCGILILLILFLPVDMVYSPEITAFMDGFEYEGESGFMLGDKILKVNGFKTFVYGDLTTALQLGEGKPFDFVVERDGKRIKLDDLELEKKVFSQEDNSYKYGFIFGTEELNFGGRIGYAFKNAASFIQSAYKSFGMLISGQVKANQMMGTVGIASEMNTRAKESSEELWYFLAFISINLAVVNMLPIPALDGGKVLFILIEAIVGKKLNPKYENYISIVGLALILGLFVFVTVNDILRIIR
ncbi:MAG: site-2 protease family protein [Clostridia bacterium]|nr:site-2 protease family protein [Clostridia bacterium]MBR4955663.1 site-2 protease family protein [Clostridia bacterium]